MCRDFSRSAPAIEHDFFSEELTLGLCRIDDAVHALEIRFVIVLGAGHGREWSVLFDI